MTPEQDAAVVAALERIADNLAILAFVTGSFDVGTPFGVAIRDAVRNRAAAALGIQPPQFAKPREMAKRKTTEKRK